MESERKLFDEYEINIQLAENEEIKEDEEEIITCEFEKKRELLSKTKIVKQTWSILEIFQKIQGKKLILSPEYQRNVIWDKQKQTAFIESLFMGIIIPPIYVVEIPGNNILEETSYEVVDGKQRLTTLYSFLTNSFKLEEKSLEYYKDWFAKKFFMSIQSEHESLTNEMLSSVLDIYVITANSPEFTKYDIFSRLNKGAEKLKVNEIRKAIYRSKAISVIDDYVKKNVDTDLYKLIFTKNDIKRYEDYGRFYRSIAFFVRTNIANKCVDGYNSRPRDMINDVLYQLQNDKSLLTSEEIENIINNTIQLLLLFSDNSFKHYYVDACIPFVKDDFEKITSLKEKIVNDEEILQSLQKSPSTTTNVNTRVRRICMLLQA